MPQIPPGSPWGDFLPPPGGSLPLRGRWLAAGETDEGSKPSSGRGWTGEAGTGVGRYDPGPGAAPLPALGGVPFIRGYCGRQVVSPHPSRALPVPPSPRGKAASGWGEGCLLFHQSFRHLKSSKKPWNAAFYIISIEYSRSIFRLLPASVHHLPPVSAVRSQQN